MVYLSNGKRQLLFLPLSAYAVSCNTSRTMDTFAEAPTFCQPSLVGASHPVMTIPLLHDPKLGLLLAETFIGNPPVSQFLIVDTSSLWTAIPCYDTRRKNRYNPLKSATSKTVTKDDSPHVLMEENYRDGSYWSGYLIEEYIGFNEVNFNFSSRMVPSRVACQTKASNQFQEPMILGVLGLESSPHLLSTVLNRQRVTAQNSFSLCVGRTRGLLTFGKLSTERHTSSLKFAPISVKPHTGFYSFVVTSVWLGKACLVNQAVNSDILDRINAGFGAVIDSGTSDTYFPKEMEELLELPLGIVLLPDFIDFPIIRIFLKGDIELTMSPYQYTRGYEAFQKLGVDEANRQAILSERIHFTERHGAVLGLNSLLNREICFDIENKRVGIAEANCD